MQIYKKANHYVMHKDEIDAKLSLLPIPIQNKIKRYNSLEKQQSRIEGIELLKQVLIKNQFDANKHDLEYLKYNKYGKPFIDVQIDFSISYSNEWVFLGFIKNGLIGIDVEKETKIDFAIYKDFLTTKEWDFISKSVLPQSLFLKFWTRKEAVTKALGYGAFLEFRDFEVIEDLIIIEGITLHIETQFIEEKYWFSVATNRSYEGEFSLIYL